MRDDPFLGIDACRRLDMLRIVEENICEVFESSPSPSPPLLTAGRVAESYVFWHADLFHGALGLLEGVHLATYQSERCSSADASTSTTDCAARSRGSRMVQKARRRRHCRRTGCRRCWSSPNKMAATMPLSELEQVARSSSRLRRLHVGCPGRRCFDDASPCVV